MIVGLGHLRLLRYVLSGQREDLDKSIIHLTESILFPPRSWQVHGLKILQTLSSLALVLVVRLRVYGLPEDAISAAKYLRYLQDQPHQAFGMPRYEATGLLVGVLAYQVDSEAGDVMENLGEMAVLCRELLTLDTLNVQILTTFSLLFVTLLCNLKHSPPDVWVLDQPVDEFIEFLRAAREHQIFPNEVRLALASCLYVRYSKTHVNDDYEEAVSMLDEVITSSSPEDSWVASADQLVTMLAVLRSAEYRTPEYSEEAIYRIRDFLGSYSTKEPFYPGLIFDLENAANQRSLHFRSHIEGLEESLGNLPLSRLSLRLFGMSWEKYDDDSDIGRTFKNGDLLMKLLFGIRNYDGTRIDETIERGRTILASSSPLSGFHQRIRLRHSLP